MCRFLSVVILRNGDVLHHPLLDSHSDLVTYFKLPDDSAYAQHFAKAELTPTDDASWIDSSKWEWRIDEPTKPGWLADVESQAEATSRAIAQRMVLTGEHPLILEGCHIVPEGATVRQLRGGRIIRICGGTVSEIRGGTVSEIRGGTVSAICGGTVSAIWGGTVSEIWGGTVPSQVGSSAELGKQAAEYYEKLKEKSQATKKRPRAKKPTAKAKA